MKDEIISYTNSNVYPFHMPGHKRQFREDIFPYALDLTEIDGFDNLHQPSGIIRATEIKAAQRYSAQRAFLLVNGATAGVLSAMKALTSRGDSVIIARNCHTSVHHAAELLGLKSVYFFPEPPIRERAYQLYGSVDPLVVKNLLHAHPGTKLVIITSPTYEGVCSDIQTIAQICHDYGVKLFVDEAHGAHFPFHDKFPCGAMQCGADVSVVSLHKTMPALTQTALLLTNDTALVQSLQSALAIFQTSSPSYVLMSSIAFCLDTTWNFDDYVNRIRDFENDVASMNHLKLLFRHNTEYIDNLADYDSGKLVISTYGTNLTGTELADILRERYQIEVEMAAFHYIIAMTSVCDTAIGFSRLKKALLAIDQICESSEEFCDATLLLALPERRVFSYEITKTKSIPFEQGRNCISAEDIFAYPPGIPILLKGEILSGKLIQLIMRLRDNGVHIVSGANSLPESILVADL